MKRLVVLTVALILSFSMIAEAQGRGAMNKGFGQRAGFGKYMQKYPGFMFYQKFSDKLDLSDSQLEKMEKIDDQFQKTRIDIQSKIQLAALELRKAVQKDMDKNTILAKQDKLIELKSQMQKTALAYKIDLYNLLNDDQKDKIQKIKMEFRQRMFKGMQKGMGPGSGMRGQKRGPWHFFNW